MKLDINQKDKDQLIDSRDVHSESEEYSCFSGYSLSKSVDSSDKRGKLLSKSTLK